MYVECYSLRGSRDRIDHAAILWSSTSTIITPSFGLIYVGLTQSQCFVLYFFGNLGGLDVVSKDVWPAAACLLFILHRIAGVVDARME